MTILCMWPCAALADTSRPELDTDPGPGRPGRLRDRMLPRALAAAPHPQQVAVADVVPEGWAPAAKRPEQQRAGRAQRQDRHNGVLRAAAADGVAVPGHAVP